MTFVNRERELSRLVEWWESATAGSLAIIWGRRRVGKTEILRHFAEGRPTIFHTAARRPVVDELRLLSVAAIPAFDGALRDLTSRPFTDWTDAIESFAVAAQDAPLLLVLDEFPELVEVAPELPSVLRAVWERARPRTKLRIVLCGSAVRTMQAMQTQREPLYGRFDLSMHVQPFRPHEAAMMLGALPPAERALVWGIVGGIPQYLAWWDTSQSVEANLARLACRPDGRMILEGDLIMATEGDAGDLAGQILYAVGAGRTKFSEIKDAVRTDPTRMLERLRSLRLIDRIIPVTEDEWSTRRRLYQIDDNFLAFWLGVLNRYRSQIDLDLGQTVLPALLAELNDFMGPRWEEAFRLHLRLMAADGRLGEDVVAIGPFWATGTSDLDQHQIDAVALAGRDRRAVLVGEAKWSQQVDGSRIRWGLEQKAQALPKRLPDLRYAVAARREITGDADVLRITAEDIFG